MPPVVTIGTDHTNYIWLERRPDGLWDLNYHAEDSGLYCLNFEIQETEVLFPADCTTYSEVIRHEDWGDTANASINSHVTVTAHTSSRFVSARESSVELKVGVHDVTGNITVIPAGTHKLMTFDFGDAKPGFITNIVGLAYPYDADFPVTFAGIRFWPFADYEPDYLWITRDSIDTIGNLGDPLFVMETFSVLMNNSVPYTNLDVEILLKEDIEFGSYDWADLTGGVASMPQTASWSFTPTSTTMDNDTISAAMSSEHSPIETGSNMPFQFTVASRSGVGGINSLVANTVLGPPEGYWKDGGSSLISYLSFTNDAALWTHSGPEPLDGHFEWELANANTSASAAQPLIGQGWSLELPQESSGDGARLLHTQVTDRPLIGQGDFTASFWVIWDGFIGRNLDQASILLWDWSVPGRNAALFIERADNPEWPNKLCVMLGDGSNGGDGTGGEISFVDPTEGFFPDGELVHIVMRRMDNDIALWRNGVKLDLMNPDGSSPEVGDHGGAKIDPTDEWFGGGDTSNLQGVVGDAGGAFNDNGVWKNKVGLGGTQEWGGAWPGRIDDVAFFEVGLQDDAIQAIYTKGALGNRSLSELDTLTIPPTMDPFAWTLTQYLTDLSGPFPRLTLPGINYSAIAEGSVEHHYDGKIHFTLEIPGEHIILHGETPTLDLTYLVTPITAEGYIDNSNYIVGHTTGQFDRHSQGWVDHSKRGDGWKQMEVEVDLSAWDVEANNYKEFIIHGTNISWHPLPSNEVYALSPRITEGLTAHWQLNGWAPFFDGVSGQYAPTPEGSGTAYGIAGNARDLYSGVGSGQFIDISEALTTANFDQDTPYTISLWLQMGHGGVEPLLHWSADENNFGTMILNDVASGGPGSWSIVNTIDGANPPTAIGTAHAALNDGGWNHVVLKYDGSEMKVIINGGYASNQTLDGAGNHITAGIGAGGLNTLWIGKDGEGNTLNAAIDEVAIWSGIALPDEVIAQIYQHSATHGKHLLDDSTYTWPDPWTTPFGMGQVGYWSMPTGTEISETMISGNGIMHGNPQMVDGMIGSALMFDGTADWMEITNPAIYGLTGDMTFSAWINIPIDGGLGTIARCMEWANFGLGMWSDNFGAYIGATWYGNQGQELLVREVQATMGGERLNHDLRDGLWHHIAFTRYSSHDTTPMAVLWVDGVNIGEIALPLLEVAGGNPQSTPTDCAIGASVSQGVATNHFVGAMQEVSFWDRPLTYQEIAEIRAKGVQQLSLYAPQEDLAAIKTNVEEAATPGTANVGITNVEGNDGAVAWEDVLVLAGPRDWAYWPAIPVSEGVIQTPFASGDGWYADQVDHEFALNLMSYGPHTVTAWVRPIYSAGAWNYPIFIQRNVEEDMGGNDAMGYYLIADSDSPDVGKLTASHGPHQSFDPDFGGTSSTANLVTEDVDPTGFAWHHVAFVHTGNTIKFFINGVFDSEHAYHLLGMPLVQGDQQVTQIILGGRVFNMPPQEGEETAQGFTGYMNDIRLYARELSGTEVQTIFEEDTAAAILYLIGDSIVTITEGDSYIEEGFVALDPPKGEKTVWDGDLTATPANLSYGGSIDENTAGSYTITYEWTDDSGNVSNIDRTIIVEAAAVPDAIQLNGENNSIAGTWDGNYWSPDPSWVDSGASMYDGDGNVVASTTRNLYRMVADPNGGGMWELVADFTKAGIYKANYFELADDATDNEDLDSSFVATGAYLLNQRYIAVPSGPVTVSLVQLEPGTTTPNGNLVQDYTYEVYLDLPYASDGWNSLYVAYNPSIVFAELGEDLPDGWVFVYNPVDDNRLAQWDNSYPYVYIDEGNQHIATVTFDSAPDENGYYGHNWSSGWYVAGWSMALSDDNGTAFTRTDNAALNPNVVLGSITAFVPTVDPADYPAPRLEVVGQNPMFHTWGTEYSDPGVRLIESDGTVWEASTGGNYSALSGDLVPSQKYTGGDGIAPGDGGTGTSTKGEYTLNYSVTDNTTGLTATAERTVHVEELFESAIGRLDPSERTLDPNIPVFGPPDGSDGLPTEWTMLFGDGVVATLDVSTGTSETAVTTAQDSGLGTFSSHSAEGDLIGRAGGFVVVGNPTTHEDQIAWAKVSDLSDGVSEAFQTESLTIDSQPASIAAMVSEPFHQTVLVVTQVGEGMYAAAFQNADIEALWGVSPDSAPQISILTAPNVGTFTSHGTMRPDNPNVDYANSPFAVLGIEGYGFTYEGAADSTPLADRVVGLRIISDGPTVDVDYDPFTGTLYEWSGKHVINHTASEQEGSGLVINPVAELRFANDGGDEIEVGYGFNPGSSLKVTSMGVQPYTGIYWFVCEDPTGSTESSYFFEYDTTEWWEHGSDLFVYSYAQIWEALGVPSVAWGYGELKELSKPYFDLVEYKIFMGHSRGLVVLGPWQEWFGSGHYGIELFDALGAPAQITEISGSYNFGEGQGVLMAVGHTTNGGILFRSEDGGESWERVVTNPDKLISIENVGANGYGVWVVGGENGVFGISFNDGYSFENLPAVEALSDAQCCGILYASSTDTHNFGQTIFQDSTGATWISSESGLPGSWGNQNQMPTVLGDQTGVGSLLNPSPLAFGYRTVSQDPLSPYWVAYADPSSGYGQVTDALMLYTTRDNDGPDERGAWYINALATEGDPDFGWHQTDTSMFLALPAYFQTDEIPGPLGDAVWVHSAGEEYELYDNKDTGFEGLFESHLGYHLAGMGPNLADPNQWVPSVTNMEPVLARVNYTPNPNAVELADMGDGTWGIYLRNVDDIWGFQFEIAAAEIDPSSTLSSPHFGSITVAGPDNSLVILTDFSGSYAPSGEGWLVQGLILNGTPTGLVNIFASDQEGNDLLAGYRDAAAPTTAMSSPNNVKWFGVGTGQQATTTRLLVRPEIESTDAQLGFPPITVFAQFSDGPPVGLPVAESVAWVNSGPPCFASDNYYLGEDHWYIPQVGGLAISPDTNGSTGLVAGLVGWTIEPFADSDDDPVTLYMAKYSPEWGILMVVGTSSSGKGCVFKSLDMGGSWTPSLEVPNTDLRVLDGDDSGKWVAAGSNHTLYRSENDGLSWKLDDTFDHAGTSGEIVAANFAAYPIAPDGDEA